MPVYSINLNLPGFDAPMFFNFVEDDPMHRDMLDFFAHGKCYEADLASFLVRVLKPGDVFFDVGANCGFFSVLGGALVGSAGHVVAFEPVAENSTEIVMNAEANGLENITVVAQPLSNRIEEVEIHINSDSRGGHALWDPAQFPGNTRSAAEHRSLHLLSTTLDEQIRALGAGRAPKAIKIDTEGAEALILEGGRAVLRPADIPFIVAELHEFGLAKLGSSQASLRGMMRALGYDCFLLQYDGSLPKFVPEGTRIVSEYFINVLFARADALAEYWREESVDPIRLGGLSGGG
ncbi:MAG: FkbM family methyltransferase [Betaproteobacteria bacterium]|nr:FkbM family methyltransferase [Betaproteobacteria bacterium]